MIRILLVEDDEVFRLGITASLKKHDTLNLVGTCSDGKTAIATALELKPDLVLMDIGLPLVSGIQATRSIKAKNPDIKILVLTSHAEPKTVEQIMSAGADGFCLKGISTERLHALIREVDQGVFWVDPAVAEHIKKAFRSNTHSPEKPEIPGLFLEGAELLTEREQQVLALIAEGRKNQNIADILTISPGTVRVHVHSILHKLNVKDRTQAALFVVRKQPWQ